MAPKCPQPYFDLTGWHDGIRGGEGAETTTSRLCAVSIKPQCTVGDDGLALPVPEDALRSTGAWKLGCAADDTIRVTCAVCVFWHAQLCIYGPPLTACYLHSTSEVEVLAA